MCCAHPLLIPILPPPPFSLWPPEWNVAPDGQSGQLPRPYSIGSPGYYLHAGGQLALERSLHRAFDELLLSHQKEHNEREHHQGRAGHDQLPFREFQHGANLLDADG